MVAINFTVFQDKILAGRKCQTIRQTARCKPGDRLQLYTGMRTKACRKLGEAVCVDVVPVTICGLQTWLGKTPLTVKEEQKFAIRDGFENASDMIKFFREKYGLPFDGHLILWRDFQPAEQV